MYQIFPELFQILNIIKTHKMMRNTIHLFIVAIRNFSIPLLIVNLTLIHLYGNPACSSLVFCWFVIIQNAFENDFVHTLFINLPLSLSSIIYNNYAELVA